MTTRPIDPTSETVGRHESMTADRPRLRSLPSGQPTVSDDAWVAPGATLVGAVTLGSRSSVWYGAVLRGDGDCIEVGEGSNIQDGCVLHTDPGFPLHVGDGVSVGHRAVLHGCDIADGVLVGMGAVVLNGARVGPRSLVAAGAVVLENAEIPAQSLVAGAPAKVRRPLTDDEVAALGENARDYEAATRMHAESAEEVR
jgi:carbonic anhydrase/acetyltransferase-like protein (isoleucine patch superfamily)